MPDVDVLVVGAGPAGSVAAWHAQQAAPELDVVLLERDRAVGAPVRCAEGVGDAGLREFANPDGADWAARRITRVIFQAPDDTEVIVAERGIGARRRRCPGRRRRRRDGAEWRRPLARAGQRAWPGRAVSRPDRDWRRWRRDDGRPLGRTRYARAIPRH